MLIKFVLDIPELYSRLNVCSSDNLNNLLVFSITKLSLKPFRAYVPTYFSGSQYSAAVSSKKSQNSRFQLHVCLSMFDLLVGNAAECWAALK